jgi:hypothetical protein
MPANLRAMTQRVDIPASDLEDLLKVLARQTDRARSARTTLRLLALTEWSARSVAFCIIALTGAAIMLSLIANGGTMARANPAAAITPNRSSKADPLGGFNARFRDVVQTPAPAALDPIAKSRFAFIRGGLDDAMLTWTPARPEANKSRRKTARRKPHSTHKPRPRPTGRTTTTSPRQPWLIDLIIRHMAQGS